MKSITTLLLLIITSTIFSQSIKYKKYSSEVFSDKTKERGYDYKLIMEDEKYYYFDLFSYNDLHSQPTNGVTDYHSILKITKDLKTKTKKVIELKKKERTKGFYKLGNNIIAINKDYNRKENTNTINIKTINKSNFNIENTKNIFIQKDASYTGTLDFEVKQSEDKSKIAILCMHYTSRKKLFQFGIIVIDDEFNILYNIKKFKPSFNGMYNQEDYAVSNNGDVYMIGRIYNSSNKYISTNDFSYGNPITGFYSYNIDNPNYKYQIYKILEEGSSMEHINLEIPDYDIRNINIKINEETILGYGTYRKMGTIDALGCFVSEINIEAGKIRMIDSREFKQKTITAGFNEKELSNYKKRKEKDRVGDPFNYNLSEIKSKEDGGKYFIAEQRLNGTETNSNYEISVIKLNDIYIIDLDEQNKIETINKVSKRQTYYYPWYLSYSEICIDNTHYLIFNTTKKAKLKTCILASISDGGAHKEVELMKYKGSNNRSFIPARNSITAPNTILYTTLQIPYCKHYSFETLKIEE